MENKVVVRSLMNDQEIEEKWIEGYASVFNQRSKLILEDGKLFYEIIENGAFDEVLRSEKLNVKAVVDHDTSKLLARSKSGTLQLEVDETGLKYRFKVPNTQLGRDIVEMVERGDIYESSFKYTVRKDGSKFERDENGDLIHRVRKVSGLFDVSLVVDGAFANTAVTLRSLEEFEQAEKLELERMQAIKDELVIKRNYLNELKNEGERID